MQSTVDSKEADLTIIGIISDVITSIFLVFTVTLGTNIFLFSYTRTEGFKPPQEVGEYVVSMLTHLTDYDQTIVVLSALMIASLLRGSAHGLKRLLVYNSAKTIQVGNEIPKMSLWSHIFLDGFYWVNRIILVISVLVLSPTLDPTAVTSVDSVIGSLTPFAQDFVSGDFLTFVLMVIAFGIGVLIWRASFDSLDIPAAIQKEAERQGLVLVAAAKDEPTDS